MLKENPKTLGPKLVTQAWDIWPFNFAAGTGGKYQLNTLGYQLCPCSNQPATSLIRSASSWCIVLPFIERTKRSSFNYVHILVPLLAVILMRMSQISSWTVSHCAESWRRTTYIVRCDEKFCSTPEICREIADSSLEHRDVTQTLTNCAPRWKLTTHDFSASMQISLRLV